MCYFHQFPVKVISPFSPQGRKITFTHLPAFTLFIRRPIVAGNRVLDEGNIIGLHGRVGDFLRVDLTSCLETNRTLLDEGGAFPLRGAARLHLDKNISARRVVEGHSEEYVNVLYRDRSWKDMF